MKDHFGGRVWRFVRTTRDLFFRALNGEPVIRSRTGPGVEEFESFGCVRCGKPPIIDVVGIQVPPDELESRGVILVCRFRCVDAGCEWHSDAGFLLPVRAEAFVLPFGSQPLKANSG